MFKRRFAVALVALIAASFAYAQDAPAMDPEACAKHCREMAAAHQKTMDQRQAAWKQIEAQLDVARNARGDKKVAALESVVEKLVAFHGSMPGAMPGAMAGCPKMGGHGPGHMAKGAMDCGAGEMKDCCRTGGMGPGGHGPHCPMMKGAEAPKPAN